MRKILFIILAVLIIPGTCLLATNEGEAGGSFKFRSTVIKRDINKATISGVLINESDKSYSDANFVVQTFNGRDIQNGFGVLSIRPFPAGQPRNFSISINLFDNTHVSDFKISFSGGDIKR